MSQSVSGSRPTFLTSQINGLGAVRYQNSKTSNLPVFPATAGHTFFVVKVTSDPAASAATSGAWDNTSITDAGTRNTHYPFTDGVIYETWGTSVRKTVGDPAAALTGWRVYEVITTSSEYTVKVDGTQIFTTGTNTVGFKGTAGWVGASRDSGSFAMDGYIAGIYHADAKLSAGDRSDLIDYINDRFALSSS